MNDNSALYAFNKFGDTVLRTAFAMTGSYPEAEDITQEVFLSLHASPQDFEFSSTIHFKSLHVTSNHFSSLRNHAISSIQNDQISKMAV